MNKRKLSSSIFTLVILSFFLQFVTVSCDGRKVAEFNSMDLAFGTTVDSPVDGRTQETDENPVAIVMLAVAATGIGLGFYKRKIGIIASVFAGGIGAVLDIITRVTTTQAIEEQELEASYGIGFYSIFILFLAAAGLNAYMISKKENKLTLGVAQVSAASSNTLPPQQVYSKKYCSECGYENLADNNFCKSCGTKFEIEGE